MPEHERGDENDHWCSQPLLPEAEPRMHVPSVIYGFLSPYNLI